MPHESERISKNATWTRYFWVGSGIFLLAICARLSWLSFGFVHGEGFEDRPLLEVVGLLLAAGCLYFLTALASMRGPPSLPLVLVIALSCRVVLLFSVPIQEDDIYRYIWDGKVVARGIDPFLFSPEEVLAHDPTAASDKDVDPRLEALAGLRDRSPQNRTILERVNHRRLVSLYPPFSQVVFAIPGYLVPASWSVPLQVTAMKILIVLFDLATVVFLVALLRRSGLPTGHVVLYAWCPLVLKEMANSGHMDAIPTFFVSLGLLAAVASGADRTTRSSTAPSRGDGWSLLSGLAFGFAIASKFYAALLLPLVLRRLGVRGSILAGLGCGAVLAGFFLLFREGAARRAESSIYFALDWELNAAVFLWLEKVILLFTGEKEWLLLGYSWPLSAVLARLVCAAAIVLISLGIAWKTPPAETPRVFLARAFAILACLFLLGPLGFPWYFVWCTPLLLFVRSWSWFLLPGLLALYYLRFWYSYHPGTVGFDSSAEAKDFFDHVIVTMEFAVFYVAFCCERIARW